jgi:signal transduction histidine kinase
MRPRGAPDRLEQRRRRAVQLLQAGQPMSAVARQMQASVSSVWRWWQTYQRAGPRGLRPTPTPGRPPRFDARQLARWGLDEGAYRRTARSCFASLPSGRGTGGTSRAAGLISVQAALIVTLLLQRRRRQEAESASQRLLAQLAHLDRVAGMGQLATSLAHELSQPLTAIHANAQAANRLLANPQPDLKELRACVDDVIRDDRRAGEVIHSMRKLLKRTDFVRMPLRLEDLTANTIELVANDARLHAVTIQFRPAGDLPVINGDGVQIQQVILNLLTNAITAAANGAATNSVVTVWTAVATTPYVELGVHDTGKGIPEAELGRVFEPFFTTKADGLGMGLAISRTIVEAHGGRVFVENDPAGGAIFRVHLPTDGNRRHPGT